MEIRQIGNINYDYGRNNPNPGRVYDTDYLSPSLTEMGGGGRQPHIVEVVKMNIDEKEYGTTHWPHGYLGADADFSGISPCIDSGIHMQHTMALEVDKMEQQIVAMRGRNIENPSDRTAGIELEQRLEPNSREVSNTITSVQKDNLVLEKAKIKIRQATQNGFIECELPGVADLEYPSSQTRRGRVIGGGQISPTLQTESIPSVIELGNPDFYNFLYEIDGGVYLIRIRKLMPLECWRLMGFSDEDFHKAESVNSNTQLYKEAGNSIVKNCLTAIFGQMLPGKEQRYLTP